MALNKINKKMINGLEEDLGSITTQLAQKVEKGKITSRDLSTVADADKIRLVNLADEVQQALTGNAPALSTLVDGQVSRTKIAPGAVDEERVSFVDGSKNLFNKSDVVIGQKIDYISGKSLATAGWSASGFIPVNPSTTYKRSHVSSVAMYDSTHTFISGFVDGAASFQTTTNAAYVKVNVQSAQIDAYQLEKGSVTTDYQKHGVVAIPKLIVDTSNLPDDIISTKKIAPHAINEEKVSFVEGSKNLFNKNTAKPNVKLDLLAGGETANPNWLVSDFIPSEPSVSYARSHISSPIFFDKSYVYIGSSSDNNTAFVTPANTAYIKMNVQKPHLPVYQLEKGNVSTVFKPFAEVLMPGLKVETKNLSPKLSGFNNYRTVTTRENGKVKSIKLMDGASVLEEVTYNRDVNGRISTIVRMENGKTVTETINRDVNGKFDNSANSTI